MNFSRNRSRRRQRSSSITTTPKPRRRTLSLSVNEESSSQNERGNARSRSRRRKSTLDDFRKKTADLITDEDEDDVSTWGGASTSFRNMVLTELEEEEEVHSKDAQDLTFEDIQEKLHNKAYQPAGIENLGNTCYFNSVFQILATCEAFIRLVIKQPRGPTLKTMQNDIRSFFSNESGGVLTPRAIVESFREENSSFDNNHEHDASEAFCALIGQFGKENRKVEKLFQVNFSVERKVLISHRKEPIVTREDTGYVLRLLCQNRTGHLFNSVTECLEHEFGWKDQDDKLFWEEDGKRYPFKQRALMDADAMPQHLVIHLARFAVYKKDTQKLKHDILFSNMLDLAPYTTDTSCDATYTLTGVITHAGATAHSGHYTATIQTPGKVVYKCNDECISRKRKIASSGAYMLLYTKEEQTGSLFE